MLPNNFEMMKMNMEKGGARSQKSAESGKQKPGNVEENVMGEG